MISETVKKDDMKLKLIEFMEQKDIDFDICRCCGRERICIPTGSDSDCAITVLGSNRDIFRVCPGEILYIAIENRSSVLYLTHGKIETGRHLDYWKNILKDDTFAQPHHSFIVNMNYVKEVNQYFVKLNYDGQEYSIYTSSRKIRTFRKTFLEFSERAAKMKK